MSRYDLTADFSKFLDPHLVFPLLDFLLAHKVYPDRDILKNKYLLASKTNRIELELELYKLLHGEEAHSDELERKKEENAERMKLLSSSVEVLVNALRDPEIVAKLRQDKANASHFLAEQFSINEATIEALYDYAKFQYESGQYSEASDMLYYYRYLTNRMEKARVALWGKLAAEILANSWDSAMDDVIRLKDIIDGNIHIHPLQQLQQRIWFIHWANFVFFNHSKGREALFEMLFTAPYINAIQTSCPYFLRYLTVAAIIGRRKRNVMKELIRSCQQENYHYQDPITKFFESLLIRFDFDTAQAMLRESWTIIENDFFLFTCKDDFIENARALMLETYCKVHHRAETDTLASCLNMTVDEAETWIENFIQTTRPDLKFDPEQHCVFMPPSFTPHIHIGDKSKNLMFRSQNLLSQLEKHMIATGINPYMPYAMGEIE
jgi:translation initiation factor 3 subunit E